MGWMHKICFDCWYKKNPEREPVRFIRYKPEKCCFCGRMTLERIFVRQDPRTVSCKCEDED